MENPMKNYKILKSFHGNQTGFGETVAFVEGETSQISDALAEVALKEGWIELADAPAVTGMQTKVTNPTDTKPLDITKLNKKELVSFGKEKFGLELNEEDKKDDLLAAIKQAAEEQKQDQ
jgi:hypothetical protein